MRGVLNVLGSVQGNKGFPVEGRERVVGPNECSRRPIGGKPTRLVTDLQ